MDLTNIVTFKINNKQYYLHYDLVKALPLFEELKKSDRLETIEYPGPIGHEDVIFTFNLLYNKFITLDNITVDNAYKIYQFMMYLTVDKPTIKQIMPILLKSFKHEEIVDYGIQNNLDTNYFKKFPFYNDNWLDGIGAFILDFKKDDNVKIILVDKIIRRLKKYKHIYAPDKSSIVSFVNMYFGESLLSKIFSKEIKCIVIFKFSMVKGYHEFSEIIINHKSFKYKNVPILMINDNYYRKVVSYDIYSPMLHSIKKILLGKVTL